MSKGLLAIALLITMTWASSGRQWASPHAAVRFPDKTIVRVEVVDTPARRQRGLMFRESLAESDGMLFVFEEPGSYPFWMQNCLIALDIVWLDRDARVLSIAHSVPPCRLPNCNPPCASPDCPTYAHEGLALYVVEVASGFAKRHGLKAGDRLVLQGLGR